MRLIVIHEYDHEDFERTVIGVSDSIEKADVMINEYYGEHNVLELVNYDIGDSNVGGIRLLEVLDAQDRFYKVTVTLESFELNKV